LLKRSEVLDFILFDSQITVRETAGPKGYPFIIQSSDSKKNKRYILAAQRYHFNFGKFWICGITILSPSF
jgi:hypothetical protein